MKLTVSHSVLSQNEITISCLPQLAQNTSTVDNFSIEEIIKENIPQIDNVSSQYHHDRIHMEDNNLIDKPKSIEFSNSMPPNEIELQNPVGVTTQACQSISKNSVYLDSCSTCPNEISHSNPYSQAEQMIREIDLSLQNKMCNLSIDHTASAPPCFTEEKVQEIEAGSANLSQEAVTLPIVLPAEKNQNLDPVAAPSELLKLPSTLNIEAFNENDMRSIYRNLQLECCEAAIISFLDEDKLIPQQEFYELLQNYYRSRINQLSCMQEYTKLDKEVFEEISLTWQFESHCLVEEGICEDDTPVEVEHSYETASFNKEMVTTITKTMKQLREVVFETQALHCYNSEMNRILVENYIQKVVINFLFLQFWFCL